MEGGEENEELSDKRGKPQKIFMRQKKKAVKEAENKHLGQQKTLNDLTQRVAVTGNRRSI